MPITSERWQVRIGSWWIPVRAWKKQGKRMINSLTQGKVQSILFREGSVARAHENLILLETLQTVVPHSTSKDITVLKWLVRPGDWVKWGQPLAEIELATPDKQV